MRNGGFIMEEKIIRDAVHGNIMMDERFLAIIDTPEFQRLHRIKQLSTEYLVFPTAQHTRFAHSLGTYHVMFLLIKHFEHLLRNVGIKISEEDKDSALAVALLHDVGHGPFSHAFEHALPVRQKKKHEDWTVEIITNPSSSINRVLKEKFSLSFPKKIEDLMIKNRAAKKGDAEDVGEMNIFSIISSLISSKLDADRMDYLLRDSYFTGVTLGNFDIHRLIEALDINVIHDDVQVCVKEKYLTVIEEYILARYHMYNDLYFHPFKNEMEIVVRKILKRVYELNRQNKIDIMLIPSGLRPIMNDEELTLGDYISLDDTVFFDMFFNLLDRSDDFILKHLCDVFINRKKYTKINIKNFSNSIDEFKKLCENILSENHCAITTLNECYFWIDYRENNQLYKNGTQKNNIFVLCKEGNIREISEVSALLEHKVAKEIGGAFIDFDLMKEELGVNEVSFEKIKKEFKNLQRMYNSRQHIEIEKKYVYDNQCIKCKILDVLREWNKVKMVGDSLEHGNEYLLEKSEEVYQIDTYFDDSIFTLRNCENTLRIRNSKGKQKLTIKCPIRNDLSVNSDKSQQARQEYEFDTVSSNISSGDNLKHIKEYLPDVANNIMGYSQVLEVRNKREKYIIKNKFDVELELAFDDVTYINLNNQKEHHEYQLEIELKSLDYRHRVNLKEVSDYIENKISEISTVNESKYVRGIRFTQ